MLRFFSFYLFYICCASWILTSCASYQPREARKTQVKKIQDPRVIQTLEQLKQQLRKGNISSAKRLRQYLENHYQNSDLLHKAYLLFGDFYYLRKNYHQALSFYRLILDGKRFSPSNSHAWAKAILSAQYAHLNEEAEALSKRALQASYLQSKDRIYLYKLHLHLLIKNQKWFSLLREYLSLFKNSRQYQNKERYWTRALQLVQQKLSPKQLQFLIKDSSFKQVQPSAHFLLARFQTTQKKDGLALNHLNKILTKEKPDPAIHPIEHKSFIALREAAQALKIEIQSIHQVKAKNLGLILPLTGKHAARGQKILEAIRLGLSLYGKEKSPFQLIVRDSEGQADVAEQAVEELVKKDQVIAIIGSLLSRTAPAVARKAQELRITCISLSQKMDLAKEGPFVFQYALTSQRQVSFLLKELKKNHDLQSFALLYPQDRYGEEFAHLFWKGLEETGGDLLGAQSYSSEQRDFRIHIKKLLGLHYKEDRLEEYQARLEKWQRKNPAPKKQPPPEDLLPPIVDFQGLFIPDSVEILAQVASMLVYYNVKKVFLVGTNLWNTPNLTRSLKGLKDIQVFFVDNFALNKEQWEQTPFFRLYKEKVQKEPGILELNAYEIVSTLKQLIVQSDISSRYDLLNKLQKMKSLPGILGNLHISEEGEIYRPLTLFQRTSDASFH